MLQGLGRKRDSDFGTIVTQCISPSKVNDQHITNLLLKIQGMQESNLDMTSYLYFFEFVDYLDLFRLFAFKALRNKFFDGTRASIPREFL